MQVSPRQLFTYAAQGALILTANKRLFRHLREGFGHWMSDTGHQAWITPSIFSFDGWLLQCLAECDEDEQLLSETQELCLWEAEISRSVEGTEFELLQLAQTAEKAQQAHHLVTEYRVEVNRQALTEDQRMFFQWRDRYLDYCREKRFFDRSGLPDRVFSAIRSSAIALPSKIYLVGFDQLSPFLNRFAEIARKMGSCVEAAELASNRETEALLFTAIDKDDEIESAARWTRDKLEKNSGLIGIVVADLARQRNIIERIFRHQISPESLFSSGNDAPFSLSLGTPLADQGVVHAALECLDFPRHPTIDQVSLLLRSPFVRGSQREADARAIFDRRLRSFRQERFSLAALLSLTREDHRLQNFYQILQDCQSGQRERIAKPGVWARRFADQLQAMGWPGERSVGSHEYQAVSAWRNKVLERMPELDRVMPAIDRFRAVGLVKRMSRETEFQVEAVSGQVRVVGLLESSGLNFDHLWVMGLDDRLFPAQPQPNPFIPYQIQDALKMPRSNADRERVFAEQIVKRLRCAAPEVIFSYPRRDGDSTLRPSPLIAGFNQVDLAELPQSTDPVLVGSLHQPELEQLDDSVGSPIVEARVSGGTGLLKDQAHCPFRAYVYHRLQCRSLESATPGIDAIARGDLVHLALEKIWLKLRDRKQLIALDPQQLEVMVRQQVEQVADAYYDGSSRPKQSQALLALEKDRLNSIVLDWLVTVEKERDDFTVVAVERELETVIGPLSIRLKVDRIDQLDDGSRVVIDYKTGSDLRAEDFLSSPLLEPQLPIYALKGAEQQAEGIAFARIRKGSCRFVGIASREGQLSSVKALDRFSEARELKIEDWADLLAFWSAELDRLADDFFSGQAQVRPFSLKRSCQYCDLAGLCRIDDVNSMKRGGDD